MIDKSQYDESKPLDMHNLQFDIAAEPLPMERGSLKRSNQPDKERLPL